VLGAVILKSWFFASWDLICRKFNDFTRNGNVSRPLQIR
jgi:hypothetical protein